MSFRKALTVGALTVGLTLGSAVAAPVAFASPGSSTVAPVAFAAPSTASVAQVPKPDGYWAKICGSRWTNWVKECKDHPAVLTRGKSAAVANCVTRNWLAPGRIDSSIYGANKSAVLAMCQENPDWDDVLPNIP